MLIGDGLRFGERGGGECVVGQAVDFTRHSLASLEQRLERGRLEQRQLTAGEAEPMAEIVWQFSARQPGEVIADGDTLCERFMHGHAQPPAQLG